MLLEHDDNIKELFGVQNKGNTELVVRQRSAQSTSTKFQPSSSPIKERLDPHRKYQRTVKVDGRKYRGGHSRRSAQV